MWFEDLVGFAETTGVEVRDKLSLEDETLTSAVNGRSLRCGRLEVPSLAELRERAAGSSAQMPNILSEIVGDAGALHSDPTNAGAFFQVASQFNLLEMVSPRVTPEQGVGIYEHDPTQGPACAVACGAGTIYRNWFVPVLENGATQVGRVEQTGQTGQSEDCQLDCLADLGLALDNTDNRLWSMQNGYCLATDEGLNELAKLSEADDLERDDLLGLVRIGLQLDTEVTSSKTGHLVSQAYCSALPVGYSPHDSDLWEPFARLVLDATYEATLLAAAENSVRTGNTDVFLTLVGGGVFGNRVEWIIDAIARAMRAHPDLGLNISIVSFRSSDPLVADLVASFD